MAVAGLPKLDDIKNAVVKAKSALAKYNDAKGSLKSLEDGVGNLKSILADESKKLESLHQDHEKKSYLNVDSYNSAKETYDKALENYQKLTNYLKSDAVKNDSNDYKNAKSKYDDVYSILNSNRWFEESNAYKAALEKAGQANQKHNTAKDWFDNNDYLKQNSGYQDLVKNLKSSEETYNRAKDLANNENYLKDNSDYNNKNNTFNDATKKLEELNNLKNNGQYLRDHGGYQDALREIENKRNQLNDAENRLNDANDSDRDSLSNKKGEVERAYETAQSNANKKREEADQEINTKIQNQEKTRDTTENELNRVRQESEQKANTARETAERSYNEYREKEENTRNQLYDTAKNAVDTTKELRDSTQSETETAKDLAKQTAQKAADDAKTTMDGAENRAVEAAYPKLAEAQKVIDANGTKLGNLEASLSTAAYKNVEAQDKVVSEKDNLYKTAENKYNENLKSIEPELETYNSYAGDVVGYAKQFRENLADISSASDVTAAKSLFGEFNKLIDAGGFTDDVKSKITPHFNGIEFKGTQVSTPETPASAKARQLALQGGDPNLFSNIDPVTGLPLLNRDKFDSIVATYGNNVRGNGKARAAFAQDGWNMMSDSALLLQGPAILGLSTGTYMDMSTGSIGNYKTGIINSKGESATDNDYLAAAKQIGVDGDSFTMPIKFVPAGYAYNQVEKPTAENSSEYTNPKTGETYLARIDPKTKEFIQALDTKTLYADIYDKTKDLYYVANAIENVGANKATAHAGVLYKAGADGVLTPVLNENKEPIVNYYEGERVHHAGATGQLQELMPFIQMATMFFAPQLGGMLNSAIGGIQVSAAVAPTAFTMGLPAVTLLQTIGATGVSMISGVIQNVVKAGLTGGDIGQAALVGAVSPALAGNSTQLLNRVGIDQVKIDAIASATNTTPQQVTNMLANAVTLGVTGAVLGDPNALENAATSLAGQYVGTQAQNLVYDTMKGADPKTIAATVNAAGNVSNIATQTLINGGDVGEALKNAAPAIITGAVKAGDDVGKAIAKIDGPGTATIEERSTYPEPTLDPSDVAKPDPTLGKKPDSDYYDQLAEAFDKPLSEGVGKQIGPAYAGEITSLPPVVVTANPDNGQSLTHTETVANRDDDDEDYIKDTIFNLISPNFNAVFNFAKISDPNAKSGSSSLFGAEIGSVGNAAKSNSWFEFLGETSSGKPVFRVADANGGNGPLVTLFVLEGQPPKLVNADSTVTVIPLDVAEKLQDQTIKVKDVLKANKADAPVFEDNTLKVVKEPPKVDVKLSDIVDPNKQPVVKPVETKPTETTTTAGGSSTAAPTPAPTPTLQQQVVELQKQADAAQVEVLNTANNFIQNPTPENKAKADSAKLNYELVVKVAEAAKAGVPLTQAPQPAPTSGSSGSANQPIGAPSGSQQTGAQQPLQPGAQQPPQPGSQQPAQPGVPLPVQPGSDQPSQTTSTTPGSGTSNLPGDSTNTTAGTGGNGIGGVETGTGSGTGSGTGTGSGAGTGAEVGSGVQDILAALAGAFGSGKVSTGGLSQVPAGYTAVTTPLAKRAIGDLYPVSFTMMSPEEIAARSSTKIVRRGGLVSMRK